MLYENEKQLIEETSKKIQKELDDGGPRVERAKVGALLMISSALWGILDVLRDLRYDVNDAMKNRP